MRFLLALLTFLISIPLGVIAVLGVVAYVISVLAFTLVVALPVLVLFAIAGSLVIATLELID